MDKYQCQQNISLDLTFIVNEPDKTLKDRFKNLIKDCKFFDCIVAYFYISGFHLLYKELENTEKIRILIGISTDKQIYNLLTDYNEKLSHFEIKNKVEEIIQNQLEDSEDKKEVEDGISKFIEWIKTKKLEIRAYPSQRLHAKVYIMTFKEHDRDIGRVITGSSNFTQSGLIDNLEFNVELKNSSDYIFAKEKFEKLWGQSVEVSEKFVETITEKTWLKQNITPYELYLKFIYEYFKNQLTRADDIITRYLPENFKRFKYQEQAVLNAKKIIEEHGGVFISDVVGLGKTYITAMLASQLNGRTLIIAPPSLISKTNPGSWFNAIHDFHLPAQTCSIGNLKEAKEYIQRYEGTDIPVKNVVIDEAHKFRNDKTLSYEALAEICRGKRVILVSATPYNNSPKDIIAQIKLFQNIRNSTIPGISNLEGFFEDLERPLKKIDRQKEYQQFIEITKQNAKIIREKVLKYLMVRRTRNEIEKYFADDLEKNNVKFPEVIPPQPIYYQLNNEEDNIFMETVQLITQNFKSARYTPLLYLKNNIGAKEQPQKNMCSFMKVLLVKRLESSFYAFKNSIERFINSYENFINEYHNGNVYISKKYTNKIFELIEEGNDEEIHRLIEEEKAQKYKSTDFVDDFEKDLKNDLSILKEIKSKWDTIKRDPKLDTLLKYLKEYYLFKDKKIIIFTESKETAQYLANEINNHLNEPIALAFYGNLSEKVRDEIIDNFDAKAKYKKDNYRILVSTEVLSEGVNLHRSNIVINYDIPWNPTRLIQRIGRVNRIDTPFDKIYTFNFFPTKQSDSEIELTNIARSKIEAFLTLLGGDSAILTDGEPVSSHELFDKLHSSQIFAENQEVESELKYLKLIEKIRDEQPELFEKIKRLPKKARSAKLLNKNFQNINSDSLITFFKKGKLMKFFLSNKTKTQELDFITAAKILESQENEKKENIPLEDYYELLDKNKKAFNESTIEGVFNYKLKGNEANLLNFLKFIQKNSKQLTDEQEDYLNTLIDRVKDGAIPKNTVQKVLKEIEKFKKEFLNPIKLIGVLQKEISPLFLKKHYAEVFDSTENKKEVILSIYLK